MDAEQTIAEIEWLERIFAERDTRVLTPADLAPLADVPGAQHPTGTSEADSGGISSFHPEQPVRPPDDPARFGGTVERLDYLFSFPGALYTLHADRADVVIEQWAPGRDMSDHYGIEASIDTTALLTACSAGPFKPRRHSSRIPTYSPPSLACSRRTARSPLTIGP